MRVRPAAINCRVGLQTVMQHHYRSSGGDTPEEVTLTVAGTTIEHVQVLLGRLPANNLYYPKCFILADGTVRVSGKIRLGNVASRNRPLWPYINTADNSVANLPALTQPSAVTDVHLFPVQVYGADGKLYNFQEDNQNSFVNIEQSTVNLYTFSQLAEKITDAAVTENIAYCKVYSHPTGKVLFARDQVNGNSFSSAFYKGDTNGQNWGTQIPLTDRSNAGEPARHYTAYIRNGDNQNGDGWYYGVITYRDADINHSAHFPFKTQDFETVYNIGETFSKELLVDGAITPGELTTHMVSINAGTNNNIWLPVYCVSDNGNVYGTAGDGSGGYVFLYYSSGWQQVAITTIANLIDSGDGQNGAINDMWAFGNKVSILCRIDNGAGGYIWKSYYTENNGTSWTEEYTFWQDRTNILFFMMPDNFQQQVNGTKFAGFGFLSSAQTNAQNNYWQPLTINR